MDIPTARNRCEALATRRRDAAASARASADEYRTRAQDLTGDRRDLLLNIANQNDIDILVYDFGGEEFKPKPDRKFNPSVFTSQELAVLQQVVDRFAIIGTKSAPTSELVETSHKELAWLENAPQRKLISYKYAFELSQI